MADYQPLSRRPIADMFRRTAQGAVRLCVRVGIHPNTVSYASIVAAAGAGLCFWQAEALPALLIPAVGLCYLRLWFNMLDGMVALASGKASRAGEIVNELPDRISDVIIFAGVAHSGLCHPLGGYWAAVFALLVAYVGILGQAVARTQAAAGELGMSPQAALESPVFRFYLAVAAGLLVVAGAALALLKWGLHKDVDHAWRAYRGWLLMVPLGLGCIFLGRAVAITFFTVVAAFGFKEFARATGLYQDWFMTGAVYLGIIATGIVSLVKNPNEDHPGWYGLFMALPVYVIALI